jgi:hypothetical protein
MFDIASGNLKDCDLETFLSLATLTGALFAMNTLKV